MVRYPVFLLCILFGYGHAFHHPMNRRVREELTSPSKFTNSVVKSHWFTQKLDHFNNGDIRTWKQRYYSEDIFFKPNGPVFLMIGGEAALTPGEVSRSAMAEFAKELGAMMFGVEHRFYGESHPLGDTSTDSMQYLSSEQALADLAVFHQAMVEQYNLTSSNKWIVFGGSYPGALAAWFRYKYPHLIHGAVASSAPIKTKVNFTEYAEIATKSLGSKQCMKNVKKANAKVESYLKSEAGRKFLSKRFRTCKPLTGSSGDIMQFVESLIDNFYYVIQYNRPGKVDHKKLLNSTLNIDVLCAIMTNEKLGNLVDRLAVINDLTLKRYRQKCFDVNYDDYVKEYRKTSWNALHNADGGRQWGYQQCTDFGFFQTTDSPNQVFGTLCPISFFMRKCFDIFGPTFNATNSKRSVKWSHAYYGGIGLTKTASRIIFPNGSIDPWYALSVVKSENDVEAIFIKGTSHCADMHASSPKDLKELTAARSKIKKVLKKWLSK